MFLLVLGVPRSKWDPNLAPSPRRFLLQLNHNAPSPYVSGEHLALQKDVRRGK
ncbi:hypothetical protein M407DRAFT_243965 [Tulasnella calospora MUT 4182]|uniref:Uncharacterized protein n=1 Tax=Tulasnella calospora MUT 4182 TaxID=1051891 RepID=A0A0C3QIG7_9AGAM|nr:hypothetical protein M407DRAFT_243965 [Tulasnella calospora MUT 4182]